MSSKWIFFLPCLFLFQGCATAKFVRLESDSYQHPFGFAGGAFTCEGNACNSGYVKARTYCGKRKMAIVDQESKSFVDTMILPVTSTTNTSGTATGFTAGSLNYPGGNMASYVGGGMASYNGTSSTTNYVPYTYTRTFLKNSFICADDDVSQKVYSLVSKTLDHPLVCSELPEIYVPGAERLWRVAHESTNDDCISKQGWLKYVTASGDRKNHLFVGAKGLEICKQVERELFQRELTGIKAVFYVNNTLICPK